MKTCTNCGAELGEQVAFCHLCGASQATGAETSISKQQFTIPKNIFYVVMIALALMGLAVVGLAARGPSIVTQTQTNYVTQMQLTTYSFSFTSTTTQTQPYTVTMASSATLPAAPPPSWFNGQYCGYPFNPYACSEGPPVTVTGYLTTDSSCVDLSVASGVSYVVWNLNATQIKLYENSAVQVYGFVYPNWPQTQPFPPYPFQRTLCIGIPMWAIPPYIQAA